MSSAHLSNDLDVFGQMQHIYRKHGALCVALIHDGSSVTGSLPYEYDFPEDDTGNDEAFIASGMERFM